MGRDDSSSPSLINIVKEFFTASSISLPPGTYTEDQIAVALGMGFDRPTLLKGRGGGAAGNSSFESCPRV